MIYKKFIKRIISFSIAFVALLCIGWLIVIVAIWLHFANKGAGAFFLQERPGKNGKIFGSISSKQIADEYAKNNIQIDKKIIKLDHLIDTLGVHLIKINLHKKVVAEGKIIVKEG